MRFNSLETVNLRAVIIIRSNYSQSKYTLIVFKTIHFTYNPVKIVKNDTNLVYIQQGFNTTKY